MEAHRSRRTKDQARKAWYAHYRQVRFARWFGSSRRMPTSIESSSIYRHLHARSSPNLVRSLNLR